MITMDTNLPIINPEQLQGANSDYPLGIHVFLTRKRATTPRYEPPVKFEKQLLLFERSGTGQVHFIRFPNSVNRSVTTSEDDSAISGMTASSPDSTDQTIGFETSDPSGLLNKAIHRKNSASHNNQYRIGRKHEEEKGYLDVNRNETVNERLRNYSLQTSTLFNNRETDIVIKTQRKTLTNHTSLFTDSIPNNENVQKCANEHNIGGNSKPDIDFPEIEDWLHDPEVVTETWRSLLGLRDYGVCIVEDWIYIIGGHDLIRRSHTSMVRRYSMKEDEWQILTDMFVARSAFAVAIAMNKIYVTGGERTNGQATRSCEALDLETLQWERVGLLPDARMHHACTTDGNTVYVSGGICRERRKHRNVWLSENFSWHDTDEDYPTQLSAPVSHHCMQLHRGALYFFAGIEQGTKKKSAIVSGQNSPAGSQVTASLSSRDQNPITPRDFDNVTQTVNAANINGIDLKDQRSHTYRLGNNLVELSKGIPQLTSHTKVQTVQNTADIVNNLHAENEMQSSSHLQNHVLCTRCTTHVITLDGQESPATLRRKRRERARERIYQEQQRDKKTGGTHDANGNNNSLGFTISPDRVPGTLVRDSSQAFMPLVTSDVDDDSWFIWPWDRELPAPRHPRRSAASIVLGHNIYLLGGTGHNDRTVRQVECFDLHSKRWRKAFRLPNRVKALNVSCVIADVPSPRTFMKEQSTHSEPTSTDEDADLKWVLW